MKKIFTVSHSAANIMSNLKMEVDVVIIGVWLTVLQTWGDSTINIKTYNNRRPERHKD